MLHQVAGRTASLLAVVEHGEARVLEITVPAGFVPRALKSIGAPEDAIVAAILRGDRTRSCRAATTRSGRATACSCSPRRRPSDRVHDYFSGAGA